MLTRQFNNGFIATHGNIVAYGSTRTEAMSAIFLALGIQQ